MRFSKRSSALFIFVGIIMSAVGAYIFFAITGEEKINKACTQKYYLTSQTVGCDEYEDSAARLQTLNELLDRETKKYLIRGDAKRISVWVRDLNTRQFAAINEFEKYAPASLYKVPIMIAYYKYVEYDPTILNKSVLFTLNGESENTSEYFKTGSFIISGNTYTVDDLIERMIVYSDNDAARLLAKGMSADFFSKVLIELGLVVPTSENENTDFVTVKTYANIYRALYNMSYLNRDLSQKALELLHKTKFGGIKDSLPASVQVVHKFGERTASASAGPEPKLQLHDCGIIYKTERSYTLCIMSEGSDFERLLNVIKEISSAAYKNL